MHTQFNKDVSDYKSNFWKGLTLRQTIFGGLAVASFVIFRVVLNFWYEGALLNILGFGFAFVFAFLGFFKKDRLTAEEFSLIFVRYMKTPKVLNCANKPVDIIPVPPVVPETENSSIEVEPHCETAVSDTTAEPETVENFKSEEKENGS